MTCVGRRVSVEDRMLSDNALLNARIPLHRLPRELLAEVFLFTQSNGEPGAWLTILHVCRHWFVVAATTPRIWCTLLVRGNVNLLRTGLARVKSCPVTVAVDMADRVDNTLTLLSPHMHNLSRLLLHVVAREDVPLLTAFMENRMPMLQFFSARILRKSIDDSPSEPVIEFTPERHPRLKSLGLHGIQVPPSSTIFSQLTHLELRGWLGIAPELALDDLARILRSCINLHLLIIENVLVSGVDHTTVESPAQGRTLLPNLRLVLIDTYSQITRVILGVLSIPPAASVHVRLADLFDDPEEDIMRGIRASMPADRSSLPLLAHIKGVNLTMTRVFYTMFGSTDAIVSKTLALYPHPWVELTMEVPSSIPTFGYLRLGHLDLLDVFRGAPLEVLDLTIDSGMVGTFDWPATFWAFPALQSFKIRTDANCIDVLDIFSGLGPRRASDSGGRRKKIARQQRHAHTSGACASSVRCSGRIARGE